MRAIGGWAGPAMFAPVLALMVVGCTGLSGDADPEPVNRLVFMDLEGRVVTSAPDGSDQAVLSADGEVGFQPIWSPDGTRVAYAAADGGLSVADVDSGSLQHVSTEVRPFYMHWSPSGDRIAALRNSSDGIALEIVEVAADGLSTEVVDTGQPYYLSWQPGGERLVVHVGTDRLDLLEPSGETEALGVRPGAFQAPHWAEPGIVATTAGGDADQLVLLAADGDMEVIAEYAGAVTFAVDPTGQRVAVQPVGSVRGEGEGDGGNGDEGITTTVALEEELAVNQLYVIDVDSGEVSTVTAEPAVAFFWSPDGERLLLLTFPGGGRRELQWTIWSDDGLVDGPAFVPLVSWVQTFLPFYDQYARSMTLWSPDSGSFAFPGRVGSDEGIWVHDLDSGTTSKVADGTWVAWSHQ